MSQAAQAIDPHPRPAMRPAVRRDDWYLYLLFFVLTGYACLGRSFAYIGAGSLYVGEATLAIGLLVLLRTGCRKAVFNAWPHVILALLMTLVVVRTLPYLSVYRFDALRDSVIVMYGLYAFIVAALLLEAPGRLSMVLRAYSRFATFIVPVGICVGVCAAFGNKFLPVLPSGVPIVSVRLGELAGHLAGAAVFTLLGMRKPRLWWTGALVAAVALLAPSRAALLACFVGIGIGALLGRRLARLVPVVGLGLALFVAAYVSGIEVHTGIRNGRVLSAEQVVEDLASIAGSNDAGNLDATKAWRLEWWGTIIDYTFHGPYFWSGKGFGVNLAVDDGFLVGQELGGTPLRSPHSGNFTILARTGIPGLTLWVLLLGAWFGMMIRTMFMARRRGDRQFDNLFVWVVSYVAAMLVDASFDVALEGPMLGIWFWCLIGLGCSLAMIYRAARNTLPPGSTAPIAVWQERREHTPADAARAA